MGKISRSLNSFTPNQNGATVAAFALSAPILAIGIAGAVQYSNEISLKQQVQTALDSAALAANSAVANGMASGVSVSMAQASQIATNYFKANAPAGAVSAQVSFSASTSSNNGTISTTVSYQGAPATLMQGMLGGPATINATAVATSQVSNNASSGAQQYAGSGYVLGDPHILGADGSDTYFACASPSGSWYNLLSDSQFEINVNCVVNNLFDMDAILDMTTLAGTHVVQLTSVNATFTGATHWMQNGEMWGSYQTVTYPPGSWVGDITIDGVVHSALSGTHTYLADTSQNVTVTVTVGAPGTASSKSNYVTITTPTYTVNELYYNVGMGYIALTAANAGQCGTPGGFWGGTLAGVDDGTGSDFLISSQTYKATEFYWSTCETIAQNTRLTK